MYLVIGAAESSVKVTPMLLTVPFASTEEGRIYEVQAYPKAEKSNTAGITVRRDFIVLTRIRLNWMK